MFRKKTIIVVLVFAVLVMPGADKAVAQATTKLSRFALRAAVDSGSYFAGVEDSGGTFLNKLFSSAQIAAYVGGGGSINWNTTALRWNGNYIQHVKKHSIILDSVSEFAATDTFGFSPVNINALVPGLSGFWSFCSSTTSSAIIHPAGSTSFLKMTSSAGSNSGVLASFSKTLYAYDSAGQYFEYGGYTPTKCGILINTSNGKVLIDSAYYLPQTDGITHQVPVTSGTGIVTFADLGRLGLVTNYNGSGAAGNGFKVVRANNDFTAVTFPSSIVSIAPVTGTYEINAYVNITSVVTDALNLQVSFTDVNSVPHIMTVLAMGGTGVGNVRLGAVKYYPVFPVTVRAKAGTLIIVSTVLATGGGSITYDAGATITQVD